jgi:riboflavin kinase/FMN adenylyltransferase
VRPTLQGDKKPILEVHLFDFSQAIYGTWIKVEFHRKLRDEQKFDSVEQLRAQLQRDIEQARNLLTRQ